MHFLPFLQFESVLSATCHLLFCFLVILKKSVFHYLKTYPYFSMVLLPSLSPDLLSPHLSAWAVSSNFSHPKTQLHSSSHHLTIYVYQLVFSFKMDNKNFFGHPVSCILQICPALQSLFSHIQTESPSSLYNQCTIHY